jgi:hypothetical protein
MGINLVGIPARHLVPPVSWLDPMAAILRLLRQRFKNIF